jgi:hypothetical protein
MALPEDTAMTKDQKIIRAKVGVLELAKQLGMLGEPQRPVAQLFAEALRPGEVVFADISNDGSKVLAGLRTPFDAIGSLCLCQSSAGCFRLPAPHAGAELGVERFLEPRGVVGKSINPYLQVSVFQSCS